MLKLLLSLYLAVFASIVVINQINELIWQQWAVSEPDELRHAQSVAQTLQTSINASSLPAESQNLKVLHIDDVAWLPEQASLLRQGKVLTSYNSQGDALLTLAVANSDKLIQLGPFAPATSAADKRWALKLLSYAILAFLLMLWIRPLWVDLLQLKHITASLTQGQLPSTTRRSRFSAIATLTEQIRALAAQVARLIENQKLLVNAVSHDLRTPLARLKFALAMLPKESQQQAQAMAEDVTEMEQLIAEMLAYARLEFELEDLTMSDIDLNEVVAQQVSKLGKLTEKTIHFQAGSNAINVTGNNHYLSRALQNLIQNADKYGHSQISVSLQYNNEQASIIVEDDGNGIAKEQWQSIFVPFSRLDESRSKNSGGYGLGLAIVRKIAQWHHGECEVGEASLGGAKFTLTLPLKR
ncbi:MULTISPECIES: ATP-binding protein [unclassified Pseudoalteromonas]|uniref:ATP-binding protein n=1 Tax=unclassified Pseudoalteromonas TaxID=194690 RepID=UPI00301524E5